MNTLNKLYLHIALIFTLIFSVSITYAQVTVSGTVTTELGDPLVNVPVKLTGVANYVALTDENGDYEVVVDAANIGTYIVTPQSNVDPLNGVSTFDLVRIFHHVEGIELLNSPYKIIAADIDHSESVEYADTTDLRNLIFFTITEFPNNTSWRFVSAGFTFPNPLDPFSTAFPEVSSIVVDQSDVTDIDFIGVKIGDINNSAFPILNINPCDISCGTLSGNLFYDLNENCAFDTGEQGLQQWIITANSGTEIFHTVTDEFGNYSLSLFPATYEVTVSLPNDLWNPCQDLYSLVVEESDDLTLDIPVKAVGYCPAMEVDLATPFLRRCFDGYYVVQYCNKGTQAALGATVEVTFDSFLTVTNTSIPWTTQNGNTYTFDLGDVGINECDIIFVDVDISCDAVLGETFCSEAHIYPDTLCIPPPNLWDGSNLELFAHCEGDSVRFEIINQGDPMSEAVNYIVIEDDMIMMTGDDEPILLGTQENRLLSFPANGSTWRLELDQTPNHPLNEMLSAAIEGCGMNGDGSFSLGFITQFPQYTESPAVDVDCVEGIGSWDPNDKSAIPVGAHEEHFMERNTDLNYLIRFQNTGTDTAFTVVVIDTLSKWLDVTSIRNGAASHPYDFQILEGNILEFTFQNIMLPDSNVNEIASHGFIKFNIAQLENNPLGTVIENSAAIYFDFNAPVITNTVFHTVGENFLDILDHVIIQPTQPFNIKLYPNLINESTTLKLDGVYLEEGTFLLYDLSGRLLSSQSFSGNSIAFYKNNLPEGMYLFEVHEHGQRLSSGKLVVR